jgi:hypothetical protein
MDKTSSAGTSDLDKAATSRQKGPDPMQGNSRYYVPANEPGPEAAGIHRPYPFMEWSMLVGAVVDVRREGVFVRTGFVEDATPSGDTAWIAADGLDRRIMIEKSAGYDLWITAEQLQLRRVHQPSR